MSYDNNFYTERDLKFRVIKLQLYDGTWKTYFNPSQNKLKKLLIKYQPKGVFCSIARWLNFREHNSYENRFLDSDILIDLDDTNDIEEVDKINSYLLKKYDLKLRYKIFSGGGFHLIYCFKKRLDFEENKKTRRVITKDLRENNFPIDSPVCEDIYRVSRIPNTYNGNRDKWCYSLGSSFKGTMTKGIAPFIKSEEKGRQESETNLPAHYFYNFISNSVCGTKGLYIPVIKWRFLNLGKLKHLIRQYSLGSFIHIRTTTHCYIVFLKCFDERRIGKIYNFAKSSNRLEFFKYKWNWIPIKGSEGFPVKMKYFNIEGDGNYSKPHLSLFGVYKDNMQCGNGNLKVWKAEVENAN